ncbi:MAG: aminopeptidase N [Nocardioidaceae bacterium]
MPSLTRDEARLRASLLSMQQYDLELDLDRGDRVFRSLSRISFDASRSGHTFADVRPERLLRATLDGHELAVDQLVDGRLPLELAAGSHELVLEADMAYSNDGEGLHRSVDPADDRAYVYAMSFLDAAPRVFGCFDQPDLKAAYRITVKAPDDWTVLGNGRATSMGRGRWELVQTLPLSTYFVTLVAGPYHSVVREHDGILLGLHVKRSLAPHLDTDADELFRVTGQSFDEYHRLFGIRYPFGDYHQCFVPEFNAGAMENPGCVTFREQMIFRSAVPEGERSTRARTIVHEMAHQWFGDLVTMQWWDDLWLNESFAEYMCYRVTDAVTDFTDSWLDFTHYRKRWGMLADQRPSTHPVAANGSADAQSALSDFDGISYAKGAAALKQLNAYVGDDVFLAGVRAHLENHAYGNATLADLLGAWEKAGAVDLDAWAAGWLRTAGLDTLRVRASADGDELVRAVPADHTADRPHRLTVLRVTADGTERAEPVTATSTATPLAHRSRPGDLVIPDSRDETWAKIRYDSDTLAGLTGRLASIADPLARATVWLAVRDAVTDAELSPAYALDLFDQAIPNEDGDIAVQAVGGWMGRHVVGRFLGGDAAARDRVAGTLLRRLESAPPGSGLQIAAAIALAGVSADVDLLSGWLNGRGPVGLVMDADMRWRVLTQVCRLGAADRSDIAAELARDRSTDGEVHASRCHASVPDADAKAAAWTAIMTDGSLSNYHVYALCEGFWQPEQSALTAAYVPRYFDELPATQELRTGWLVAGTAEEAFPVYDPSPQTIARAAALSDDDKLNPAVRRAVADCLADLRQAAVVRAASAAR